MNAQLMQIAAIDATGGAGSSSSATRLQMNEAAQTAQVEENSQASEIFRQFIDNFQSQSADYARTTGAEKAETVETAKAEFEGRTANAASGGDPGGDLLNKSFDHAIFVTLVSQVVGGVSQAASTLVKQG